MKTLKAELGKKIRNRSTTELGESLPFFPSIRPHPELDAARKLEVASREQVGRTPGAFKDWGKRLLIFRKRAKSHHFFFSLLCSLRPQSPSNPLMAAMGAKEAIKSRNQWNGKQKNNGENFKEPKVGSWQISLKLIGFQQDEMREQEEREKTRITSTKNEKRYCYKSHRR